jgi:hypothetical protein
MSSVGDQKIARESETVEAIKGYVEVKLLQEKLRCKFLLLESVKN